MPVPPPAPPPPPKKMTINASTTKGIAKIGPITATPPAVSTILPIQGAPRLTPTQAIKVVSQALTDPPTQKFVIDTIGAARAGNPEANADAQLLSMADAVNYSAGIVEKWFGKQQADNLRAMAHLGLPVSFSTGAAPPAYLGRR